MNHPGPDEFSLSVDERALEATQHWLEREGTALLTRQCAWAVQRYDRFVQSLPEATDPAMTRAVEKRRREFSAGRVAASAALKKLGVINPSPPPVGTGRDPRWPSGFTGSITHTSGFAIAAVARSEVLTTVGIDLERAKAVQPELWPEILRPSEINFISGKPSAEQPRWATILFCAKESFYKMQYPLTGEWVGFQDAEISISENDGAFELACTQAMVVKKLRRSLFAGRYVSGTEFSLTALGLNLNN